MAFGLFKKKTVADVIYHNGHIYTQDPEFPWAEAVACKDGYVLAVGELDGMDEILSEETELVDLDGKYLFPGFIDAHGIPALKALEDLYLFLDPVWDLDAVQEALAEYAEDCEAEILFGCGYHPALLTDYPQPEERQQLLDEVVADRPVILLDVSGYQCWVNTPAAAVIAETAAEEGADPNRIPVSSILMNILPPFDADVVQERVRQHSLDLADRGFTAVLDLCAPEFFSALYRDSLVADFGEGEPLYQRFYDSLYINRPLHPLPVLHRLSTGRTACTELDGFIHFDMLKLECSQDESLAYFPGDTLAQLCLAAAEKGFDIHLDALDAASFDQACDVFALVRDKGYKRTTLVLASDQTPEEDADFLHTWPTDLLDRSFVGHVHSVEEAIDELTIKAAALLGKSRELGVVERGKRADFTVLSEDPFAAGLRKFSDMHADLTILDGQIVYNVEDACAAEMYDLMRSMHI